MSTSGIHSYDHLACSHVPILLPLEEWYIILIQSAKRCGFESIALTSADRVFIARSKLFLL